MPKMQQSCDILSMFYEEFSHIAFGKAVYNIRQNPKAKAIRYDDTRTILLDTFPYLIHFSINDDKHIIIISAVLSTSRDPEIDRI